MLELGATGINQPPTSLPSETEESHEKPQSGLLLPWTRFEAVISRLQTKSFRKLG
jgi:hypothetical protein